MSRRPITAKVTRDGKIIRVISGWMNDGGAYALDEAYTPTAGEHMEIRTVIDHARYFTSDFERDTVGADRYLLLAMRCRLPINRLPINAKLNHIKWAPLEGVHIWFSGDKAFVFYVAYGKHAVLEDDAGAFPSDTLVASLKFVLDPQ